MARIVSPAKRLDALLAFLMCLLVTAALAPARADASEWSVFGDYDMPYVESYEAMVADGDGNVLYTKNADTPMAMASITKVMTAVVALESGIDLNSVVPITQVIYDGVYGQALGLVPGDQLTLDDLLHGLLVYSGNDAAMAIAEYVGGSVPNFVAMMNAKALELGMYNTHYANPHGLDADAHFSTPSDLITLARHAMQIPYFASVVGSAYTTITMQGQPATFWSTDELTCYYPGMMGIKTGYTDAAGRAFLGACSRGGRTLYFCVIGAGSEEARWGDSERLLDWGFAHYEPTQLISPYGVPAGVYQVADHFGWYLPTTIALGVEARMSPFEYDTSVSAVSSLEGTSLATQGDQVGQVSWYLNGQLVSSRSIAASGSVLPSSGIGMFGNLDWF